MSGNGLCLSLYLDRDIVHIEKSEGDCVGKRRARDLRIGSQCMSEAIGCARRQSPDARDNYNAVAAKAKVDVACKANLTKHNYCRNPETNGDGQLAHTDNHADHAGAAL